LIEAQADRLASNPSAQFLRSSARENLQLMIKLVFCCA